MRRWHLVVLALLATFALACEGTATGGRGTGGDGGKGGSGATRLPSSMAALGDSITAGFGACLLPAACERRSWATGTDRTVDSHYRRLLDDRSGIETRVRNYARTGAESADLDRQARAAVKAKAAYVTVLIGANDACAPTEAGMTAVATYRKNVDAALRTLKKGLPKSRVLVVSIPDLYRLWRVGHDDARAVRVWNHGVCPSLLVRPTSTAAADDQRRRRVGDRVDAYNDELRDACSDYGRNCRWDGGAVHGVRFAVGMLNRIDYFHPNAAGQARLADATWPSAGW